ncbi:MAG: hydrogenase maturation nickel metallochaperone HypA [Nanoarchaeota archaeon]|nr:hydrogenase maturation nickel metallochaperone HypA [Nanoarchaeota archaeon]
MVDVKISCRTCGKKASMDNMKYDPENRKLLVCPECFNAKAAKLEKGSKVKQALQGMHGKKEARPVKPETKGEKMARDIGVKDITSEKVEYKCNNCKYSFSRAKGFLVDGCPYCGQNKIEKRKHVQHDWVKDIES